MGHSFIFWVCLFIIVNLKFIGDALLQKFRYNAIKKHRQFLLKFKPAEFKIDRDNRIKEANKKYEQVEFDFAWKRAMKGKTQPKVIRLNTLDSQDQAQYI